jgi:hypothetical protein
VIVPVNRRLYVPSFKGSVVYTIIMGGDEALKVINVGSIAVPSLRVMEYVMEHDDGLAMKAGM